MIPDDKKCHNKGKSYNVGDVIPDDEHPICQAACRCSEVNGINEFNCASIECPEIFAPPPSNCVPQPVPNECCPEYVCGNDYFQTFSNASSLKRNRFVLLRIRRREENCRIIKDNVLRRWREVCERSENVSERMFHVHVCRWF